MEKPTLTKAEEFVLEQIFKHVQHHFDNYHFMIEELKNKVFDALQKEDDLKYWREDDIPIEQIFPDDDDEKKSLKRKK